MPPASPPGSTIRRLVTGLSCVLSAAALPATGSVGAAHAQDTLPEPPPTFTFQGEVRDYMTELPIPGASVQIAELKFLVMTDHVGRFAFPELAPGRYTFVTSGFGYETNREQSTIGMNAFMVVRLNPMAIALEGIEVTVERLVRQLEIRRLSTPRASEAFETEVMEQTMETDVASFVDARTSLTLYRDQLDRLQVRLRGRQRPLRVCLDEVAVASGFLGNIQPGELGLLEVYEGMGMVRMYTKDFLSRAAREGFSPAPIPLVGRGC
ncbi:MAG: carboxypeptidase-like regulatory domain-containing protein [Gemmatimonadetes bacterium]|nr:carboxypeptidase-like regulatory domain-containing protein [Gemmatimonadota bacterium]MCY3676450.1 carboxypeptidase-like regulatory domain-containing protein [Gemmatimonadota bacterium]MYA43557.1 carboxypeptidase-like regulatory domain-containing protein [Gemmatimonadota bacterium]MYE92318.1 carboxypeptidase-like regulatory domain-containing protein [Gemmatimonadota bacterium]MYJ08780.1 carboxypeptidase-like regulatory domain-containing protein [Gemmatimonadota bacterium]